MGGCVVQYFAFITVAYLGYSVAYWPADPFTGMVALSVALANLAGALACRCARHAHRARVFEVAAVLTFAFDMAAGTILPVFDNSTSADLDHGFYRLGAISATCLAVAAVFLRPLAHLLFSVWSASVGIAAVHMMGLRHGASGLRVHADHAFLSMSGWVLCLLIQSIVGALYEAQLQLTAEKEGQEALLRTSCDAVCWLSADANTVARSDGRLETLLGRQLVGAQLSSLVTAEEPERLRLAFAPLTATAGGLGTPVALHTTLVGARGLRQSAELVVTDRRSVAGGASAGAAARGAGPHFLMGVRFRQQPELGSTELIGRPATPREAPSGQDQASELESRNELFKVPVAELEGAVVEIDAMNPELPLRRLEMRFAPTAPSLETPTLAGLLQEQCAAAFRGWIEEQVNLAWAEEDGRITAEVPLHELGSPLLLYVPGQPEVVIGERVWLEVVTGDTMDADILTTLRVLQFARVRCQRQLVVLPAAAEQDGGPNPPAPAESPTRGVIQL